MDQLVNALNALTSAGFDALVWPAMGHPLLEAPVVGLAAGIVASLIFWRVAPRATLSRFPTELSTHLLEIWLYRRLPRVVLNAELRLLTTNLRLLAALIPPLLVSSLAVAPLLVQSHYLLGLRAAPTGEPLLVTVAVDAARVDVRHAGLSLTWQPGQGQILGPLRQPFDARVTWRVHPQQVGACGLALEADGWRAVLPLQVGEAHGSLAPTRRREALPRLLDPRGRPLEGSSPVLSMAASYPRARGTRLAWLGLGSAVGALLTAVALGRRSGPSVVAPPSP